MLANARIEGMPFVRVFGDDKSGVTLVVSAVSGDDILIHTDTLAQLEAIADAIYHFRMDCDSEAMQAASPQIVGQ